MRSRARCGHAADKVGTARKSKSKIRRAHFDYLNLNPKNAAVMMLVYPKKNNANLALILRTSYNGVHSSQVAFPGGKAESFDKNSFDAVSELAAFGYSFLISAISGLLKENRKQKIVSSSFILFVYLLIVKSLSRLIVDSFNR